MGPGPRPRGGGTWGWIRLPAGVGAEPQAMPLASVLAQRPRQRLQLLLEASVRLLRSLAPRARQPGHLGEGTRACLLCPLPALLRSGCLIPTPRAPGAHEQGAHDRGQYGRYPAALGRSASTSATSTRPHRAAARPASASACGGGAQGSGGRGEVCNAGARGPNGRGIAPLPTLPGGDMNGVGEVWGPQILGGWLTSPAVPTSSSARGEV